MGDVIEDNWAGVPLLLARSAERSLSEEGTFEMRHEDGKKPAMGISVGLAL